MKSIVAYTGCLLGIPMADPARCHSDGMFTCEYMLRTEGSLRKTFAKKKTRCWLSHNRRATLLFAICALLLFTWGSINSFPRTGTVRGGASLWSLLQCMKSLVYEEHMLGHLTLLRASPYNPSYTQNGVRDWWDRKGSGEGRHRADAEGLLAVLALSLSLYIDGWGCKGAPHIYTHITHISSWHAAAGQSPIASTRCFITTVARSLASKVLIAELLVSVIS